nr:antibiotic biosynthesis monooxygenase [Streptomyces durhamensis]
MKHQPGFVCANFHASLDGERVLNYAQWETEEHCRTMLDNPENVGEPRPGGAGSRLLDRPAPGRARAGGTALPSLVRGGRGSMTRRPPPLTATGLARWWPESFA